MEGTDNVAMEFHALQNALIDASSIIYMKKAGYFTAVAKSVKLYSPRKVILEVGEKEPSISPLDPVDSGLQADESLVESAFRLNWPVITEDLGIIRQLKKRQIRYFNALMMLEYLWYKQRISPSEYDGYLDKLLACAWYGSEVIEFGESVHRALQGTS
jgi:hypothetical protein